MIGYRVKFEYGRGHRMVLEGEPPIRSEEIDAVQYRMLTQCEVPGLLSLETEEMDGAVALRYSLSGRRMLSQAMRASRWTMEDALTALCRLAEALETSRDYMLDLERYVLDDDFIFAGESWHDLAFAYLPLWRQTASASLSSGLEKLIVRWMMNVEAPDGQAMQQLLRLASSPDFAPAQLRRYARQYLAGASGSTAAGEERLRGGKPDARPIRAPSMPGSASSLQRAAHWEASAPEPAESPLGLDSRPPSMTPAAIGSAEQGAGSSKPSPGANAGEGGGSAARNRERKTGGRAPSGRIPPEAASQGLSGWLGEDEPFWMEEEQPAPAIDAEASKRRRIWLVASAVAVTAAVWRFAYLPAPSTRGLWLGLGVTLLAVAACVLLWGGKKPNPVSGARSSVKIRVRPADFSASWPRIGANDDDGDESVAGLPAEEAAPSHRPRRFGVRSAAPLDAEDREYGMPGSRAEADPVVPAASVVPVAAAVEPFRSEQLGDERTSWLGAQNDGTRLLGAEMPGAAIKRESYLEWEAAEGMRRIRLSGDSIVIGRSRDAAQHVDGTEGISRAHLELIREDEVWRARDLGSRNGSWLNGVPMAPYEMYPLNKGDTIQIASSLYRYQEG